jgi:hypothetical protein
VATLVLLLALRPAGRAVGSQPRAYREAPFSVFVPKDASFRFSVSASDSSSNTGSNPVGGIGPVAQLVEQGTFNPKVAGSIPARPISDDHGEHGNAASARSVLLMASPRVW